MHTDPLYEYEQKLIQNLSRPSVVTLFWRGAKLLTVYLLLSGTIFSVLLGMLNFSAYSARILDWIDPDQLIALQDDLTRATMDRMPIGNWWIISCPLQMLSPHILPLFLPRRMRIVSSYRRSPRTSLSSMSIMMRGRVTDRCMRYSWRNSKKASYAIQELPNQVKLATPSYSDTHRTILGSKASTMIYLPCSIISQLAMRSSSSTTRRSSSTTSLIVRQ